MDAFFEFLTGYGYWGMLVTGFLAGSVFPFSSETVMLMLLGSGLDAWWLVVYGTIGNVLGSVFNYYVGRLGKIEWIEKYLKIKKKNMDRAQRFMAGRGAWMGFFAFLPIIGSAITVTLGFMRANMVISFASIAIGKFLRYWLLIYGANWIFC
jgi:membrane protein YqaA with SNARE-associated domain